MSQNLTSSVAPPTRASGWGLLRYVTKRAVVAHDLWISSETNTAHRHGQTSRPPHQRSQLRTTTEYCLSV